MRTHTIRLHRVLRAAPEKVYRAFLDADAASKWLPPHGFTCRFHHLRARVGGTFRFTFTNFTTGSAHSCEGKYLELTPHRRIRYTGRFVDPGLPGETRTTVALRAVPFGTEVGVVQEGVPGMIPADACHLGWQDSLSQLAQLVEPDIPD